MPPEIAIARPTGDYRASPIEEVTVGAKAADEFGLSDMHLHYSVNGGPDHDLSLLKTPGAKSADGSTVLPLEDFKLVPGDVISVYATARDGHSEARTDISFIQVDPFEREFSQSQQSGGGGGGGGGNANSQTEISRREKELIAATWKQQNDKTATPKDNTAQGQFLSDAQQKLRDQVNALSVRMQSRDISEANQEFTDFDKDVQAAAAAMGPASDKLKSTQWKDAMPLEQKALQALLRAEATFRQIEVAFGQRGGGGGGGGGSTGRDLASLFDLELDTEKNQYETAQSASPAEQHEKDVEDALAKLDALAKRQDELANQQHNPQQSFQERWQQEMLRREAEQLQRQMEQMAQNGQQGSQQGSSGASGSQSSQESSGQQSSGQQNSGQQSSSQGGSQSSRQQSGRQSSSSSGSQSQTNGQRGDDQRVQQALSRLNQATDAMKRNGDAQQSTDAAREAADRLRDATSLLAGSQQQMASNKVDSMAHEAGRLSQEERDQAERINKLASQQSESSSSDSSSNDAGKVDLETAMARMRERDQLAGQRQELSNDLSRLQKNLRDTAREMAPNEPGVAQKLRDALTEMDDSDLDNHVQRTADWLRSGINPNSNGTEGEIAQGLQKLNQQLQQAQSAMGQSKPGADKNGQGGQGDTSAALSQLDRLRGQLETLGRQQSGSGQTSNQRGLQAGQRGLPGQAGQNGRNSTGQSSQQNGQQNGQQPGNGGAMDRNGQQRGDGNRFDRNGQPSNQAGQAAGQAGQSGQNGQARDWSQAQQPLSRQGQAGGNGAQSATNGGANSGNRNGGALSGDTRNGGGGRDGTVWGNYDTGNNTPDARGQQQAAPTDASGNPADTERNFDQGMRELTQLRQMVHDDPQAAKDVADLTRQMQNLDPRRFPGNPAMVEHMHQEVLSAVDKLELQLEHDGAVSVARSSKPSTIPAGYRDSVAEYYRKLSKNP
jgi:hypothetical protein